MLLFAFALFGFFFEYLYVHNIQCSTPNGAQHCTLETMYLTPLPIQNCDLELHVVHWQ